MRERIFGQFVVWGSRQFAAKISQTTPDSLPIDPEPLSSLFTDTDIEFFFLDERV